MASREQRGGHHRAAAARRLPRHSVQRRRAHALRHDRRVDLGHAGVSVPAALGAAPVARPRRRAHPQGTGSAHARASASTTSSSCARSTVRSSWTAGRIRRRGRRTRWTGFSTGEWVGNTLKVTTTHLKDGYLKRGGPQTSDMLHDDGVHHPPRRDPHHRHGRRRSDLHGRAVRQSTTYTYRPDGDAWRWRRATARRSPRTAAPIAITCRTSCPARTPRSREWLKNDDWVPAEADARRREDDLSGVPRDA